MKDNTLVLIKSDVRMAQATLGSWISHMEDNKLGAEFLMPFKHAYLRLNWWIIKNLDVPSESLPEEEWLKIREKGHSISPSFLPCHNGLIKDRHQPCNTQSSSCHCMELLGCVPVEGVSVLT